jgi:hypothetical protein
MVSRQGPAHDADGEVGPLTPRDSRTTVRRRVDEPPATDPRRRAPKRTALIVVVALLSGLLAAGALVAVLGGDGDEDGPRVATRPTGTAPAGAGPGEPLPAGDELERRVARSAVTARAGQRETGDVADVREARILGVECARGGCEVDYTVGVPGAGRIREQQARMLARIYDEPGIRRVVLRVSRRNSRDPASQPEPTPVGAPIGVTRCDSSRKPDEDWGARSGFEIIESICTIELDQREGMPSNEEGPPGGVPPGRAGRD